MKSILTKSILKMFIVVVLVAWAHRMYAQESHCRNYSAYTVCMDSGYSSCETQMGLCSETCQQTPPPIAYYWYTLVCYQDGSCQLDTEPVYGPNNGCMSNCVNNINSCQVGCYNAYC